MPDADIFTPALNIYKFFKEQGEQKKQRVLEQFFNNPEIATAAYGANAFPGDRTALQRIMGERKARAEEERQMNIFNSIPFEYRGYVPKNERGELDLTPEGLQQTSKTARFITALKETADKTQKKSEDIRKGNIDFKRDVAMEKIKGGIREAAESAKKLTGFQPIVIDGRPYLGKLDKEGNPQVVQQVSPELPTTESVLNKDYTGGLKPKSGTIKTKEGSVNIGTPEDENGLENAPIGTVVQTLPGWKYVVQKQTSAGKPVAVWVPERDRYGRITRQAETTSSSPQYSFLNELIRGQETAFATDTKYETQKADLIAVEEIISKVKQDTGFDIIRASDLIRAGIPEARLKEMGLPAKGDITPKSVLDARRKLQNKFYPESKAVKGRIDKKSDNKSNKKTLVPKKLTKVGTTEQGRKSADAAIKTGKITFEQFATRVNLSEEDYEAYKKYWKSRGGK